jgi:hypothetical protein
MRQYIGAVRAKNIILSPLCLFVETMPFIKAEMEIDFLEENGTFKMKLPLDRHSPILIPNDC